MSNGGKRLVWRQSGLELVKECCGLWVLVEKLKRGFLRLGGSSLKVRQGAFYASSLCPTLLPQAEDTLPRSGEQHIAATSTAPGSVVVGKNKIDDDRS